MRVSPSFSAQALGRKELILPNAALSTNVSIRYSGALKILRWPLPEVPATSEQMDQEQIGKLFRVGGAAATVGVASCVHAAAELMPLGQIMAFRALISGLLILFFGLSFKPRADLLPKRWRPHLIRGALACFAMTLSYIAFARLPITQAQTLSYLAPLIVLPLAILRLKEGLSGRLILGLIFGFAGVLLILGLSFEAGTYALWGALAGIGAAVRSYHSGECSGHDRDRDGHINSAFFHSDCGSSDGAQCFPWRLDLARWSGAVTIARRWGIWRAKLGSLC